MTYAELLDSKRLVVGAVGHEIDPADVHPLLFDFQRAIVRWAVRKGQAAIFADTGLGKTFMQLEWARLMGERTLIVAPLSVARQTEREAHKIGLDVQYVRRWQDATGLLSITNYELLDHFDAGAFGAVVLDESSILKALDGKTRAKLTEMFSRTPYRLACTATPAPNDIAEIGNHSEFLGVLPQHEMLSAFFVHGDIGEKGDRQGWRLKGHAEDGFYRWLASWAMSVRWPSDLGFSDEGFVLPELTIAPSFVESTYVPDGQLFFGGLKGITDRSQVRKSTLAARVAHVVEMVRAAPDEQWVIWCGLNAEQDRLAAAFGDDCVSVYGSLGPDEKEARLERWLDGKVRILVSKPRVCGFGLNLQQAHQMAFVGLSDSWEAYYQCVRRCWRFGQTRPVTAHVVLSDAEAAIYENVMHKEDEAKAMQQKLIEHVASYEREELGGSTADWQYQTDETSTADWTMKLGDSVERLAEIADESVDFSVFSPPFLSLYTYSPTERDIGNCSNDEQFWAHYAYIIDGLLRVTKPGRHIAVHCSQVPLTKTRDGVIGIKDFRGELIRQHVARGWIYHGEVCVDKDPQAQAIRTKNKGLLFVQKEKDRSWLRPAFADYILVFRKPGDNAVPVRDDQITNDEWIIWAHPIWYGIRESETLNAVEAREQKDERHIAPLQLEVIRRCIRLWSNPGDLILDPFAGIGSSGYVAVRNKRRFVGIELKPSYYQAACTNLHRSKAQTEINWDKPAA